MDTRKRHIDYLDRVSSADGASISTETAALAKGAWNVILTASSGQIAEPAACTGPDGEMSYSWDRGRHHLELEISPGNVAEFCYRDRETEQFWGEDYVDGDSLPSKVVEKLFLF